MENKSFLAFDIGATSGRSIIGTIIGGRLQIKELTRFPNQMLQLGDHYHWNIFSIYENIKLALSAAKQTDDNIISIGIDTWGVDFALVAKDGSILGLPYAYRDPHTDGMPEKFFRSIPRSEVYGLTGIQVMNFNSLYQLFALKEGSSSVLDAASEMLFMPDALSYLLTGNKVVEYTIASTSQILNPKSRQFESRLLDAAGVSDSILGKLVMPGHRVGLLSDVLAEESGMGKIPVIAVAGHDTASAIASVPAEDGHFAYLSSGTWSLMGIETDEAIINDDTFRLNLTNEGGVEGKTCLLKNITGMWLLEQCLAEWKKDGVSYSYDKLLEMTESAAPFKSMIDPDDPSFANPAGMTSAIAAFCKATGQAVPSAHAEFVRCIFESLSLKYKKVLGEIAGIAPFSINKLHVMGGGSKNSLLNQWSANATGIPVISGPSEATAIGNIMIQAKAAGCVGSLQEMRRIIRESVTLREFIPAGTDTWDEPFERFRKLAV
jgi:rhamnulokinase